MKQILLLIFVIFLNITFLFSQDEGNAPKRSKFIFGTDVGILYGTPIGPSEKGSTITVGTAPNDVSLTLNDPKGSPGFGLHIGVFGRYNFNQKIGLQLGLAYRVKKATYQAPTYDQDYTLEGITLADGTYLPYTEPLDTYFNGTVKGEFSNKYLEVPIVVLYQFSKKWKVLGGSYLSYLLNGSHKVLASGIVGNNFLAIEDEFSDESAFINKWDYGVNTGVNYQIYNNIECGFRISSGLRSIFTEDYVLEDTVRNLYMTLKANYTFQL